MLEFIIKQDDTQIGLFQIDGNWTYEDAMKVLGIYVSRELKPRTLGVEIPPPTQRQAEAGQSTKLSEHQLQQEEANKKVQADEKPDTLELVRRHRAQHPVKIIDRFATGKKHVMKYRGKALTGNMIAVLVAMGKLETIGEARDLEEEVLSDARFESVSDNEMGTIRYVVRTFVKLGFVKEVSAYSREITEIGKNVASMFTKLPLPSNPAQDSEYKLNG